MCALLLIPIISFLMNEFLPTSVGFCALIIKLSRVLPFLIQHNARAIRKADVAITHGSTRDVAMIIAVAAASGPATNPTPTTAWPPTSLEDVSQGVENVKVLVLIIEVPPLVELVPARSALNSNLHQCLHITNDDDDDDDDDDGGSGGGGGGCAYAQREAG